MLLPRVFEPEAMDSEEEACDCRARNHHGESAIHARLLTGLLLLALSLVACDKAPSSEQPTREAALTASAAPVVVSSAATMVAPPTASASASAPAPGPSGALAGTWEGRYEAKKGSVGLPPKVKDKGLAADDGTVAAGPGTVELTFSANGELRGKGSGALGASIFTGWIEEGVVRAKMDPDDARAPNAMSGTFYGVLKGDSIRGEIKASGPDATMVREASIELRKK